jgi:hypothetical protein
MKLKNLPKKDVMNIVRSLLYRTIESLEEIKNALAKTGKDDSDKGMHTKQMLLGAYLSHIRVIDGYLHLLKDDKNDKFIDGLIEVNKKLIEECLDMGIIQHRDPEIKEID